MATNTGSLSLKDLLSERFQSVAQFGENTVNAVITRDQATYNTLLANMFDLLADRTRDRLRISGASSAGEMVDVDEQGTAPTQTAGGGSTLGFPLRLKQYNLAWTRRWFNAHSPAEMAEQVLSAQQAHMRGLIRDMKRAIYTATNATFRDRLQTPQLDLGVKAFQNADSFPIPNGPNGETFTASSHQHYTAAASLAIADVLAAISNVLEHGFGSRIIVAINSADAAAFSALTGFVALTPVEIINSVNAAATVERLNTANMGDRMIGRFSPSGAEVWVKPWAVANYAFVFDAGTPLKPLVLRTQDGGAPSLDIVSEYEHYPIRAQFMETAYGFGVWNRLNGAVHQFSNGTYVSPTIT
jgi:hypothetical protein